MNIICTSVGAYRTVRYGFKHFLTTGHFILGHNFKYNGEVTGGHWVMVCTRCGIRAGIDVGPPREKNNNE